MPTPTPNRGYPYPDAGDPAEVDEAVQALAEAVDADLATIAPTIVRRRAFRVSNPFTVLGTTSTSAQINFNRLDFNQNGAICTFPSSPAWQVRPCEPGFWVAIASLTFSDPGFILTGAGINVLDISLSRNNTRFARQSSDQYNSIGSLPRNRTLTASGGKLMNGTTDYFNVFVALTRPAANPNANIVISAINLTVFQMTLS